MALTSKQYAAAGHTLWQVAVGSGGVGEILKSVTDHSVNVPGVEQGLFVAGAAVGGAVLSLGKSVVANWLVSHKTSKLAKVEASFAKAVKEYQATLGPVAAPPVASVAPVEAPGVPDVAHV